MPFVAVPVRSAPVAAHSLASFRERGQPRHTIDTMLQQVPGPELISKIDQKLADLQARRAALLSGSKTADDLIEIYKLLQQITKLQLTRVCVNYDNVLFHF